jgi:exodeoxyribonuclease V alpha subunit
LPRAKAGTPVLPGSSARESLEGTVEGILFYNPENGYTICKFSLEDGRALTVIGSFPPLSPGEKLKISGAWEVSPKFGQQFKVDSFIPVLPSSAAGIEKFLSSGLIKGIGPVLARRILDEFGERTIEVLSNEPEAMARVPGVGASKLREIKRSWSEHEHIRDLIIFLQEHNVSTNLATKIYKTYGEKSYQVLKTNPYQLCLDIWGIGFKTADQIALKLGTDPASIDRVKAFLLYRLEKDNEQGHVFSFLSELEKGSGEELGVDLDKVRAAMKSLDKSRLVVAEPVGTETAVYLPFFYNAEAEVARFLNELAVTPPLIPPFDLEAAISQVEADSRIYFSLLQRLAIKECFQKKILVITGGPGTGKTTIIKAVVEIFRRWGRSVLLAAPTGRAAKRLSETTGQDARTIHRVLEFNPKLGSFKRNDKKPLTGDALVVDEVSMVDLPLMYHLLRAVPAWMRVIFVGDKDQLPSVGPGSLLKDIIESGRVEVVRLEEIFRQEKDSLIVLNAHRINQGEKLITPGKDDKDSDFYFIPMDDETRVFNTLMKLACYSVPRKLGLSALSTDIQVISPMYKGLVGVDRLNTELQQRLNKRPEGLKVGAREFRAGDKVMQVRNDYEKDVFNGDIGAVSGIDRGRYRLFVNFDGREVGYEKDDLNDITLAYAITVHKAQGSEYQAVIMPLLTQHFIMLQRNLFYTALTRAKRLSIVIGSFKALYIAIKNDKPVKRNGQLKEKLAQAVRPGV